MGDCKHQDSKLSLDARTSNGWKREDKFVAKDSKSKMQSSFKFVPLFGTTSIKIDQAHSENHFTNLLISKNSLQEFAVNSWMSIYPFKYSFVFKQVFKLKSLGEMHLQFKQNLSKAGPFNESKYLLNINVFQ